MAVPFADVTDPLQLAAALVECIDEGGLGGAEVSLNDINGSTGQFLQGNARVKSEDGTVRYYPKGVMTAAGGTATISSTNAVAVGDTKNGYYVYKVLPSKTSDGHVTLDVSARKHINGDFVDECVE